MSTGSGIPTALRQGNKEVLDIQNPQAPQSTILFLLQEAVKLTPPAKQDCLAFRAMDGLRSREQNELRRQCPPPAASVSIGYCRNHGEPDSVPQRNYTGSFSLLPARPGSSPWEVMSLINLQCERLLHPGTGEEEEAGGVAAAPASAWKERASSAGDSKSTGHRRMPSGFNGCDASPAVPQRSGEPLVGAEALGPSPRGEPAGFAGECGRNSEESLQCGKHMVEGSPAQLQAVAMTNGGGRATRAHAKANQAIGWIQVVGTESGDTCDLRNCSAGKETENSLLSGEISSVLSPEGKEQGLCGKHRAPQSEPDLDLLASLAHREVQQPGCGFSVGVDKSGCSSGALCPGAGPISGGHGVKTDCNSNVIPPCHASESAPRPPPDRSSGAFQTEPAAREGALALRSEPRGSYAETSGDRRPEPQATRDPLSDARRRARKQSHPTRSPDLRDPNFKGVTFRMHPEVNDEGDQCRLLITSNYSAELMKSGRRMKGGRPRSIVSSLKTSSSEEESDSSGISKNKMCASCNTKKTPLWRDAEDGTPLCNACGIRYKKYQVRCFQCWHIPRKERNSNAKCCRCGGLLRLATSRCKLAGW